MANSKNILFVSNYTLTELYLSVALELEKAGYTVYWLCTARDWEAKLRVHFPAERVLKLDRGLRDRLATDTVPAIPLNEIRHIDREVSTWTPRRAETYMLNAHAAIKAFLIDNDIQAAFSESTWAHEIVLAMLCQFDPEVCAEHFSPHPMRIPDKRIAFFSNFLLDEMAPAGRGSTPLNAEDLFRKRGDIARFDKKRILTSKKRSPAQSALRLANLILRWRNDDSDPTWRGSSRVHVVSRVMRRSVCKLGYRMLRPLPPEDFAALAQRKRVYVYAFHKVPETSINNKGRYYEDQAARVLDLWRKLPADAVLALKEHRVSIGDRGWGYFRRLLSLSNVVLLDHRADPAMIREHAQACFTISGTMAYEFALSSKPGVTFAPTFFNPLRHSFQLTTAHFTDGKTLDRILEDNVREGMDTQAYAAHLAAHSHDGQINGPLVEPRVLSEENVALLTRGFLATLAQLRHASETVDLSHG